LTQDILSFALRAIGYADVRSGILPPQSSPVHSTTLPSLHIINRTMPDSPHFLWLALRAIGCADVRSGILPPQSSPVLQTTQPPLQSNARHRGHGWPGSSSIDGPHLHWIPACAGMTILGCSARGAEYRYAICTASLM
jgi:hypothetical protein